MVSRLWQGAKHQHRQLADCLRFLCPSTVAVLPITFAMRPVAACTVKPADGPAAHRRAFTSLAGTLSPRRGMGLAHGVGVRFRHFFRPLSNICSAKLSGHRVSLSQILKADIVDDTQQLPLCGPKRKLKNNRSQSHQETSSPQNQKGPALPRALSFETSIKPYRLN